MTAGRSSNPAAVRGVIAWSFLALLVAPAPAHAADPLYLRIESGMHSAMINRIAPIGGGGLVTVSNDKTVRLWNADGSARAVLRPAIGAGDAGALYALAAAGSHLAVAGQPVPGGAMITLIDINELRQLGTINMPSELGAATAAAFLADGALLAVGFEHGGLRLLDLAQAKVAGDDKDYAGGVTAITAENAPAQPRRIIPAAAQKAMMMGAKVVTLSDSNGFIYDKQGLDAGRLAFLKELKNVRRGRIQEYAQQFGCEYFESQRPWGVPCQLSLIHI